MAVPSFTVAPAPGHVVEFGGRRFAFVKAEAGRYMGRGYTKLTWAGACKDCGAGFAQTTSLTPRRFATRCSACDPTGAKDAADRKAHLASKPKAGRAPDASIVPPAQPAAPAVESLEVAKILDAKLTESGEMAMTLAYADGERMPWKWSPGVACDPPELLANLQTEYARLQAEALS